MNSSVTPRDFCVKQPVGPGCQRVMEQNEIQRNLRLLELQCYRQELKRLASQKPPQYYLYWKPCYANGGYQPSWTRVYDLLKDRRPRACQCTGCCRNRRCCPHIPPLPIAGKQKRA
ncbi:hypothetical protein CSKR_203289 [Clonorchis sinensis]|uniref:Uncharacterized protein n=1 Tax=Clonorchis sinensis TaxID=79923 RepID=A0A8T1MA35_CLOSI|nr:hypothetical protein CSKR_203289 [Clonorchis sinensis]